MSCLNYGILVLRLIILVGICFSIVVDKTCLKFIHKSFTDNDSSMSLEMEVLYCVKSSFIKLNPPFLRKNILLRGCLIPTGEIKMSTETMSW